MTIGLLGSIKDALRIHNPLPAGLYRIGEPDQTSPVIATGNFSLTVRRIRRVLAGRNVWLLVANSGGINVWCAAGGGHFTHHSIISAIRASGIDDHVLHRVVLLPQLSATGIERRRIAEVTGWTAKWGPARLEDLPAFLDRGSRIQKTDRIMRFPLWERLEMALLWAAPISFFALLILGLFVGWQVGIIAVASTTLVIASLFAGVPWLRVTGPAASLTYLAAAVAMFVLGGSALSLLGTASSGHMVAVGLESMIATAIVSLDLPGTTPLHPSTINTFRNTYTIELVEEACTGAAECVQVCPRNVLQMNGKRRKVEITRPDDCIRCGACIVQCPEDALRFRFSDGRIVEPATVRTTKMNLLGRRTVKIT
jgi:NAD-dependent dihydropyrimidine dehydrogenase PreA subunit